LSKLNPKLTRKSALIIFSCSLLAVAGVEIKALMAREPELHAPKKLDAVECVRCHTDNQSLAVMRWKEDGMGYLFNKDGSFKDPKLARNKDGSFKDPKLVEYLKKFHGNAKQYSAGK
jgi:hypothetical protein